MPELIDSAIRKELKTRFAKGWIICIDCGTGWDEILATLHKEIIKVRPDYKLHQVKEKFGELRFYVADDAHDAADDFINTLIEHAEAAAATTCQYCGKPGELRNNHGWLYTLCDTCQKDTQTDALTNSSSG